jgi:hypothetical protein
MWRSGRKSEFMSFLRARFPSWPEILSVLGVVVFAVHGWSVRGFLYNLPSFILKYRPNEILVVFWYHMAFAFLESVAFGACLVLLAALLPSSWIRYGFVCKGFLIVLAVGIVAIILQFSFAYGTFTPPTSNRNLLTAEIAAGVILFIGLLVLADRTTRFQHLIQFLVDQISIMLLVYLPLDAISLVVVAWRLVR